MTPQVTLYLIRGNTSEIEALGSKGCAQVFDGEAGVVLFEETGRDLSESLGSSIGGHVLAHLHTLLLRNNGDTLASAPIHVPDACGELRRWCRLHFSMVELPRHSR
ncbi:MAG TPA: hypothetical protein VMU89_23320 [Thermomicrobiaceae bacterium]|nr:hypothetical protein [Thermomicrobiaceae bacterium]